MGFIFKIVIVIYILVFDTDAYPSAPGSEFDVDVFSETSDCRKMERIMNGAIATQEMFPYLVSIQTSSTGQHLCGGTLLTPYHILTAAHCIFVKTVNKQFSANELQIRIGPSNLRLPAKVIARVIWIKIHEGFKKRPIDNDIAVIKVDKRLTSDESDIPCLSSSLISASSVLGPCIAAGWGRLGPSSYSIEDKSTHNTSISPFINNSSTSLNVSDHAYNESYHAPINQNSSQTPNVTNIFNASIPVPVPANVSSTHNETTHAHNGSHHAFNATTYVPRQMLWFTLLPLQDVKECAKDYEIAGITDEVLCAGKRNSKTDTCKGDSGGPLICDGKIEGVVSFGDGCDNPEHLGVYTRVYNHLSWIETQINAGSVSCAHSRNLNYVVLISVLVFVNRHA